jgi:DNA adenine methylase
MGKGCPHLTAALDSLLPKQQVTAPPRPVLRWHGGKYLLAPWVLQHCPAHHVYVEPFGGAASVLLRKARSYAEVYNDLDHEVVNVFRVLQSQPGELERLLRVTPFAREEFVLSYERSADPLEQARRTIIRSFMGFGSNSHTTPTGFRCNSNRSGSTPAHDWVNYPDALAYFAERLAGVVLENRPALDVIRQHDSAATLHYVDPPYPFGTRSDAQADYRHEMSDDDHRALAAVLRGVAGMVALSGYPCALYDEELFPDWQRVERRALADGAKERTEVLWLNAACWAALKRQKAQPALLEV